jgi:hypothetical protein
VDDNRRTIEARIRESSSGGYYLTPATLGAALEGASLIDVPPFSLMAKEVLMFPATRADHPTFSRANTTFQEEVPASASFPLDNVGF